MDELHMYVGVIAFGSCIALAVLLLKFPALLFLIIAGFVVRSLIH